MENCSFYNMDPNILLSIINMKLRDKYNSLSLLCDDMMINKDEINNILKKIGYIYNQDLNKYIFIDVV